MYMQLPEVCALLGVSKSYIYAAMRRGFPRPIKLGRSSRWVRAEVEAWAQRAAYARDAEVA